MKPWRNRPLLWLLLVASWLGLMIQPVHAFYVVYEYENPEPNANYYFCRDTVGEQWYRDLLVHEFGCSVFFNDHDPQPAVRPVSFNRQASNTGWYQPRQIGVKNPQPAETYRSLVERYFQPADVATALAIIECESQGDPYATHPTSYASGLFQHLPKFWLERSAWAGFAGSDIYDLEANVATAAMLRYSNGSWSDWTASSHCW